MKIIKTGVDPKTIPVIASCSNCGTSVEFLQSEGTYCPSDGYQGGSDSWSVKCPVCAHVIHGYKKSSGGGMYDR